MPRGYKKNYNKSVSAKKSRGGGGSRNKQSKQQRRRRFSPKGGQRQWSAQEIKNERALEIKDYKPVPLVRSLPREPCDVEDNISPLCNKACCRPFVIEGLQKVLLEEKKPQQQPEKQEPSYKDIAKLAPADGQEPYYFENMRIVHNQYFQDEEDQYSVSLSFDSQGIVKYQPERQSAFRRYYRGRCDTCSFGNRSSYGFDADYQDNELLVLPSLEFSVSSKLAYRPFRLQLQKMITAVYDWKYELHGLDGCDQYEYECYFTLRQLTENCEMTTRGINWLLKAYVSNEQRAQTELSLLSLGVYKCHLQQLAIERRHGKEHVDKFRAGETGSLYEHYSGWESLKASVPHKYLSSIGIIVENVRPFLLDVLDY